MSMNFVGDGEPMHNRESGWEEEALENCGGVVRRNIIPKSLTLFHIKKCDFPYSVIFQVKTGDKFSPPFSDQKGYSYTAYRGVLAREARQRRTMGKKIW